MIRRQQAAALAPWLKACRGSLQLRRRPPAGCCSGQSRIDPAVVKWTCRRPH